MLENIAIKLSDPKGPSKNLFTATAKVIGLFVSQGQSLLGKTFDERPLTSYDVISEFCECLINESPKKGSNLDANIQYKKQLTSWLYLAYSYTTNDLYNIPKEALTELDNSYNFDD